jgi:hypothetical protein
MIDAVGRTQRVVDTYDKQREAEAIAEQARTAVTPQRRRATPSAPLVTLTGLTAVPT